jgi:hypothetical protein
VSRENVELVLSFQPRPDQDMALLFRDEDTWAAVKSAIAPRFHLHFECIFRGLPGDDGKAYPGLEGLRAFWLEWMAPWASYRTEIDRVVDLGGRVLVLTHDFGRREGSAHEAKLAGGSIYTLHAGKVTRSEHFPSRDEALGAVGLAE